MRGVRRTAQNHCCAPSMYTRVLEVDGAPRLAFFARTDIRPGQARCSLRLFLSYDTRYYYFERMRE